MNKARREELLEVLDVLDEAKSMIEDIHDDEEDSMYSLPEGLQESSTGLAMQEAMETLDGFVDSINQIQCQIEAFARPKKKPKKNT